MIRYMCLADMCVLHCFQRIFLRLFTELANYTKQVLVLGKDAVAQLSEVSSRLISGKDGVALSLALQLSADDELVLLLLRPDGKTGKGRWCCLSKALSQTELDNPR